MIHCCHVHDIEVHVRDIEIHVHDIVAHVHDTVQNSASLWSRFY